jgi:hypothetical protein
MILPSGFAAVSIRLRHTGVVRPSAVTFGVDHPAGGNFPGSADFVLDAFIDTMATGFDASVEIGPCVMRIGIGTTEPLVDESSMALGSGTRTGSALPPNCALLVSKRTARGGRRGRGRLYLPWACNVTECDERGVVVDALLTDVSTRCAALLSALSAGGYPMVVLHNAGNSTPGAPDVVTSLQPSSLISSQRRRLGR